MTTATPQKPLNPDTRLARMMLPELDPHSPLLPTNKWIITTLKGMVKTHAGIRGCLLRAGGFALGAVAAVGAGIAGAVMAPTLLVGGAIGLAGAAAAGIAGFFAKKHIMKIKTDHMQDVQEIVKNKYLEMKAQELTRAWKERAEKVKQEREAKRAADAARKAQQAADAAKPAAEEKKTQADKPAAPIGEQNTHGAAPAETQPSKTPSKGAALKTFGRWAAMKAREGAHKLEDKIHDKINPQDAPKQNNADKKPAQKNAPRNGG